MARPVARRPRLLLLLALAVLPLAAANSRAVINKRAQREDATARRAPRLTDVPNGVRHVLAGAASGAIGVTALAPLELIRVNMLVKRDWSLAAAVASLQAGWFRGNLADVLAASMRVGITMPTFALYKSMLQRGLRRFSNADPNAPLNPLPEWGVFVSGAPQQPHTPSHPNTRRQHRQRAGQRAHT